MPRYLTPFLVHFLAPDGDAGSGGGAPAPERAKITLPGGVVVEVAKADAEAFHAAAQKANAERDELARRAGAAEAERKAAEEKAAREAAEKEAIRLATSGEVDKAKEILTRETNSRLAKVGARMVAQEIEAAVRKACPGIAQDAVADITALITPRAAFDVDSGAVKFGDAGAGADAFLAEWLAARKHFLPARIPAPTGGGAPPPHPGAVATIKRADVPRMTPAQAADMVAGRLKIVD